MSMPSALHLFEGFGIELEYMIVSRKDAGIASLADRVLSSIGGPWTREVENGALAWSNELVRHVIELKTNGPAPGLDALHHSFQNDVGQINRILDPMDAALLPTAMHARLRPDEEALLWQQEDAEIYNALDRIFGCQGHGWKNLQSTHLNLPFYNEREFAALHHAIRLILPLIPSIAASSPFMDSGCGFGALDNRLVVYQNHCHRFPQAMGWVIPEAADSYGEYHEQILQPIYDALKPHDPDGILAFEWINARGAIARFDRQTIEIRVTDVQECPLADIAIAQLVSRTIRWLIEESRIHRCRAFGSERLHAILQQTIYHAEHAVIEDDEYLGLFGLSTPKCTAGDIWRHLLPKIEGFDSEQEAAADTILSTGTLATRMKNSVKENSQEAFRALKRELSNCLAEGKMLMR